MSVPISRLLPAALVARLAPSGASGFPSAFFAFAYSTIPIVIGTGGAGGISQTATSTNGNSGQPGQMSGLGTIFLYQTLTTTNFEAIAFVGNQFVATGAAGGIYTSSSGATGTWTKRTSGTGAQLNGVAFSSSLTLYVTVGNGGVILTSPDSVTWTPRTSGTSNNLNEILWDGTYFVAVGNSGTILTSTNMAPGVDDQRLHEREQPGRCRLRRHQRLQRRGQCRQLVINATATPGNWTATQLTLEFFLSADQHRIRQWPVGSDRLPIDLHIHSAASSWTAGTRFAGT